MRCYRCGQEHSGSSKFCVNCGAPLQTEYSPDAFEQPQPQLQPQQQPAATVPDEKAAKPKKKKKKGLIAVISLLAVAILGGGGFFAYRMLNDDEEEESSSRSRRNRTERTRDEEETEADPTPTVVEIVETEPSASETQAEPDDGIADQTIMIYMIGTDLESENGLATSDLNEIANTTISSKTNIILQTGGCTNWQNNFCRDNTVQRFSYRDGTYTELADLGRISMADSMTLTDFITFASSEYPADDYVLILWDHGGGVPIGYGLDELFPTDVMYDYQIGQALDRSGVHFDSVIFDACNMCTLEVALALQNSADYMIGAESYVNGTGLAYTNWINMLEESPVATGDYREQVVADYMDFCQAQGMVSSMSSISLSHIGAVYDAYIDYITYLKSDIENGSYSDIIVARDACGDYMGTDSVDLITLANKYENDASTALINSIVNAVDYTESDYSYGHGITAYYPYSYCENYSDGRVTLTSLGYDQNVIDYYDEYVSVDLAYQYGVASASSYAGSWFRQDLVDYYNGSSQVTEAGEYHLDYLMGNYENGDFYYLECSDIPILSSKVHLYVLDESDNLYYFGSDEYYHFDSEGDLMPNIPDKWTYINDYVACYYIYDSYYDNDTGEWSQSAFIPVMINGVVCDLLAYYDQDNPSGMITGYVIESEMDAGNYYTYPLEDTDMIQLLWVNDSDEGYTPVYEAFPASEMILDYREIDLAANHTVVTFEIEDVYGNIYNSDYFEYQNGELVDIF